MIIETRKEVARKKTPTEHVGRISGGLGQIANVL
jgi:hypothetical protein